MNAWLPINYPLPKDIKYKKVLFFGIDWQIIDTTKGRSLVAKDTLIAKWVAIGLIEKEYFWNINQHQ